MSLSRSLEHHFCLSFEAQRSPLRDAPSVCAIGYDRFRSLDIYPLALK
jgi:hypothetical protein